MNSDGIYSGINEDALVSLSVNILDYSDSIMELFERIDDQMGRLYKYYDSESCKIIISKYNDLEQNYDIIKNNFCVYSDDLVTLIKKMRDNSRYIAGLIDKLKETTEEQAKKVKYDEEEF